MSRKGIAGIVGLALVIGVLTAACFPVAGQAPPGKLPTRDKAVVIDPDAAWRSSGWAGSRDTAYVWEDATDRSHTFYVGEPDKRHVWFYYLGTPVEFTRYPILVLTYRAKNTKSAGSYTLWLDDTRGPNAGGVSPIRNRDLIADGQVHEVRKDLRELSPAGRITGMGVGAVALRGRDIR